MVTLKLPVPQSPPSMLLLRRLSQAIWRALVRFGIHTVPARAAASADFWR